MPQWARLSEWLSVIVLPVQMLAGRERSDQWMAQKMSGLSALLGASAAEESPFNRATEESASDGERAAE